jgi:hypothetical protein
MKSRFATTGQPFAFEHQTGKRHNKLNAETGKKELKAGS